MATPTPTLPGKSQAAKKKSRSGFRRQLPVIVIAIIGVLVLSYPMTARWFTDRSLSADVTGYVGAVEQVTTAEQQEILRRAHEYNEDLPGGPLRDPYAIAEDGSIFEVQEIGDEYTSQLKVPGTESMARITIPEINVDLPIYHGTDDATLMRGVGHMFGSALPVGGVGTHSVLTAHSGLPNATMFNNLEKLNEGDTFTISVLGERLTYQIDQIAVVLPNEATLLEAVPGKDYVTLITCTPIGVNTHRVLVRGERIEGPEESEAITAIPGHGIDPGFPWWAVVITAGVAASLSLGLVGRRKQRNSELQHEEAVDNG